MVLFLLSKTLYPGPTEYDNKSLLISTKCLVYICARVFFNFQEIISTQWPPSESHKRSQGCQFACITLQRERESMEEYIKASKQMFGLCHLLMCQAITHTIFNTSPLMNYPTDFTATQCM